MRLPEGMDPVVAASLGCRFATAYRGVTAHGRVGEGDWVAVYGCGGVGLSAIQIALALGARVVAVDVAEPARRRAAELGATSLEADGASERIVELTGGGAHVAIDALGSASTSLAGVRSLRRRGRYVQVGLMLGADARAPLPWDLVVSYELEVHGSHGMAARDYPAMLAMVTSGVLRPHELVGRVITPGRGPGRPDGDGLPHRVDPRVDRRRPQPPLTVSLAPTPDGRATVERLRDAQHAWADAVGAEVGVDELRAVDGERGHRGVSSSARRPAGIVGALPWRVCPRTAPLPGVYPLRRAARSGRSKKIAAWRAVGEPRSGSAPASTRAAVTSAYPLNTAPASGV